MKLDCKWCGGTGHILVEPGSSPFYRCPDCDGRGRIDLNAEEQTNADDTPRDDRSGIIHESETTETTEQKHS